MISSATPPSHHVERRCSTTVMPMPRDCNLPSAQLPNNAALQHRCAANMGNDMRRLLLLASASLLPALPAFAADADQMAESIGEEIVVTAQKSEQKLNDVPITITAYTGRSLREIGVTQFDQLAAYVPGLNVQEQSPTTPAS